MRKESSCRFFLPFKLWHHLTFFFKRRNIIIEGLRWVLVKPSFLIGHVFNKIHLVAKKSEGVQDVDEEFEVYPRPYSLKWKGIVTNKAYIVAETFIFLSGACSWRLTRKPTRKDMHLSFKWFSKLIKLIFKNLINTSFM